jgi:hypothetical protein
MPMVELYVNRVRNVSLSSFLLYSRIFGIYHCPLAAEEPRMMVLDSQELSWLTIDELPRIPDPKSDVDV